MNALDAAGVQHEQIKKYAQLFTSKFFTGLATNRNQLNDAATPYIYQKLYAATRNDSLIDGKNVELSPRATLVRRPGLSVYNDQTFPTCTGLVNFKPFDLLTGEEIKVIFDSASYVYDATGPSTKDLLWTKAAGAGPSRFKQIENTLYWGDGVDTKKWSWFPSWEASTSYAIGSSILDSNNNIQQCVGLGSKVIDTAVSSNVLTVTTNGNYTMTAGTSTVTFVGMDNAPYLNGVTLLVDTIPDSVHFTCNITHSDYTTLSDNGFAAINVAGTSGGTEPTFSSTIGDQTFDGFIAWVCKGNSVQNMGIVAPTIAPAASNVAASSNDSWVASTYFWPEALIIDANSTPQIQALTTNGTTDSSVPTFSTTPGATTTDGTAVWTCKGQAARQTSHSYAVGDYISATYTQSVVTQTQVAPGKYIYTWNYYNYTVMLRCTVAGISSSTSTANVVWPAGLGATVVDGSVTWQNVGLPVNRTSSASSSPSNSGSGTVAGNVGNSTAVSSISSISDISAGGTGYLQTVVTAGKSGSSHPTWAVNGSGNEQAGLYTTETGGLVWLNNGPVSSANTDSWVYAYSWRNSSTGDESTASPLSIGVVLAQSSWISVSGAGTSDTQVDKIRIYRSVQGQTVPFFLAEIDAPLNGASWNYIDTTPDPPNQGAILNEFITASGYAEVNGIIDNYNDPPPTGLTNLEYHAGRMWGSVGNILYFSTGPDVTVGNGNTAWNAENFFEFPTIIYRLWPTTNGLYIFTSSGFYLIQGLGTSTNQFQEAQQISDKIAIASYNAFNLQDSIATVYTTDRQFLTIDPQNGVSYYGLFVGDVLASDVAPASAFITYHTNGLDQKTFISDGSTLWYSMAPVPSPEGPGFLWNPKAVISDGMSAIASLETTIGSFDLLVAPKTSGPILKRDLTVFSDNGTAYDAFATIGAIVMAQPGESAGVMFITIDAIKTGSKPVIGFLMDEFVNQTATPSFNLMQNPTIDPPNLPESETLYQLRYWLDETQQAAWGRFIQTKFDFGTDSVQNELLSYTIYGTTARER